jgi:alpha-beta hydrolase superfamily lysophospholipase
MFMMEKSATPAEDKVLNKIAGAYHDLYSQPDRDDIMNLEIKWIHEQIAKKASK